MMVWPDSGVGRYAEGGILGRELVQRDRHLLLIALGLGLDRHVDDRIGKIHLLEDHRLGRIAQRVAGARILEADERDDVAGIGLRNLLARIGMHEHHAADALGPITGRVEQRRALGQRARIEAAEGQDAVLVVHKLEGEHRQRLECRKPCARSLRRS